MSAGRHVYSFRLWGLSSRLKTAKFLQKGEVQEVNVSEQNLKMIFFQAIDTCDYALGLSRSLNGSVIPSERAGHSMFEIWNPCWDYHRIQFSDGSRVLEHSN